MRLGKIPIPVLEKTVLRYTGADSTLLATPPGPGLDFAAVRVGDGYLIVSADPITGVEKGIGSYAVKVSANDVATSGNRPEFIESVVLLPEDADAADVMRTAREMHVAAKEIGVSIVGGHTEVTPGLGRPIIVVTAFAHVKGFVSAGGAKSGDLIMMTRSAGLEGTVALVEGAKGLIPKSLARRAEKYAQRLSVIDEAVSAYETGFVHAMHDCTEGGVLGACFEMSLASGVGFELREAAVPVAPETARLCSILKIDPLKLIGSGALLMAVERGKEAEVEESLAQICPSAVIGEFVERRRSLVRRDGRRLAVTSAPEDELWRVLGRPGRRGDGLNLPSLRSPRST